MLFVSGDENCQLLTKQFEPNRSLLVQFSCLIEGASYQESELNVNGTYSEPIRKRYGASFTGPI